MIKRARQTKGFSGWRIECGRGWDVVMSAYPPIGMIMSLLINRPPPRLRVLYDMKLKKEFMWLQLWGKDRALSAECLKSQYPFSPTPEKGMGADNSYLIE